MLFSGYSSICRSISALVPSVDPPSTKTELRGGAQLGHPLDDLGNRAGFVTAGDDD